MLYLYKKFKASFKPWASVKELHKVIQFNQKTWLKQYIDMNTNLRKGAKMILKKTFQADE